MELTELGKETVAGHPCVENKVIVTDAKGGTNEFTVWNATDLKNFPVKIVQAEQGSEITMLFKNVALTKPAASVFDVPASYTRYDDMQTMMQTGDDEEDGRHAAEALTEQFRANKNPRVARCGDFLI